MKPDADFIKKCFLVRPCGIFLRLGYDAQKYKRNEAAVSSRFVG
jgi:hypothetical protein